MVAPPLSAFICLSFESCTTLRTELHSDPPLKALFTASSSSCVLALSPLETRQERLLWFDPLGSDLEDQLLEQWMRRQDARKSDVLLIQEFVVDYLGERIIFARHLDGELSLVLREIPGLASSSLGPDLMGL